MPPQKALCRQLPGTMERLYHKTFFCDTMARMKEIVFAPLEGIGNHIYRNAWRRHYGGVTRFMTPFLDLNSVGGMKNRGIADILPENNEGAVIIPQVLTDSPKALTAAAEKLAGYGYTEVNLNLGCPVGTVTGKGRGSAMLKDVEKLRRFLDEAYETCPIPLSLKTRIGFESTEEAGPLFELFNDYPVKELTVHPRLRSEFYTGPIHADVLDMVCRDSRNPVCVNPGITTAEEFAAAINRWPEASSVMIGRGLIADPALAEKCTAAESENGRARFLSFHDDLLESYQAILFGDTPVLFKMKELWSYWSVPFGMDEKTLKRIKKARSVSEYRSILAMYT